VKIYKWRCSNCGYISGGITDRSEAARMKKSHMAWCKKPMMWIGTKRERQREPITEEIWV
jgi:hypothetical protein